MWVWLVVVIPLLILGTLAAWVSYLIWGDTGVIVTCLVGFPIFVWCIGSVVQVGGNW